MYLNFPAVLVIRPQRIYSFALVMFVAESSLLCNRRAFCSTRTSTRRQKPAPEELRYRNGRAGPLRSEHKLAQSKVARGRRLYVLSRPSLGGTVRRPSGT